MILHLPLFCVFYDYNFGKGKANRFVFVETKMQKVAVSNIAKQIRGVSYKPVDLHNDLNKDSVILLRANNISDGKINFDDVVYVDKKKVSSEQYLQKGDILICSSSGSKNLVGKAASVSFDIKCTFGAFCKVIRPISKYANYLGMYFQSDIYRRIISNVAIGANINNIRNEHIDSLELSIYSDDKNNEIVSLLDTLQSIITHRRTQLEKLDLLVKARFVEMFGDPIENPHKYPMIKYGDLFELNAGGTPSKAKPEYWENGTISWIGSNMCQNTIIYENDGKYITQQGYDNSSAKMFPVDTVLIALVGATIGKTALLKFETSTNQNVLGVRGIAKAGYNPLFVYYYTQFLYSKFMNIGNGGFNMASKSFVSELPMYEIDIYKQSLFADFAEKTDKSKSILQQELNKAQMLFDSLMQEYFG